MAGGKKHQPQLLRRFAPAGQPRRVRGTGTRGPASLALVCPRVQPSLGDGAIGWHPAGLGVLLPARMYFSVTDGFALFHVLTGWQCPGFGMPQGWCGGAVRTGWGTGKDFAPGRSNGVRNLPINTGLTAAEGTAWVPPVAGVHRCGGAAGLREARFSTRGTR